MVKTKIIKRITIRVIKIKIIKKVFGIILQIIILIADIIKINNTDSIHNNKKRMILVIIQILFVILMILLTIIKTLVS